MEELSQNSPNPLLLDAGNLLFPRESQNELLQKDIVTAKGILDIYETLGYQAMGVGPYDLAAGIEALTTISGSAPWISSNIVTTKGEYAFSPWVIAEHDQNAIGIIALTGKPKKLDGNFKLLGWKESLTKVLDKISSSCDVIILLSSVDESVNQQVTDQFPEINLILTANKRGGNRPPKAIGSALTTQVQSRGRYLGVLTIPCRKEKETLFETPGGYQHRLIALHSSLEKDEQIERKVVAIKKAILKVGKRARYQPDQMSN